MTGDRESWNQRWRERAGDAAAPSEFVRGQSHLLPVRGRALDVAGGAGRHALWLAGRGLDVVLVDVSDVALATAVVRASDAGLALQCIRADLDREPLPAGSWDVILIHHFLCRELWLTLASLLTPSGTLMLCQPTMTNLERHASPGPRFLVQPGELESFARDAGLDILHHREGWTADGRHEAELVARVPQRTAM
jgi:tellurite methyltransferase